MKIKYCGSFCLFFDYYNKQNCELGSNSNLFYCIHFCSNAFGKSIHPGKIHKSISASYGLNSRVNKVLYFWIANRLGEWKFWIPNCGMEIGKLFYFLPKKDMAKIFCLFFDHCNTQNCELGSDLFKPYLWFISI